MSDLCVELQSATSWLEQLAANGPDLRVKAHVKAKHEAAEFADEPSLEEAADVVVCVIGWLSHSGHTLSDLADAVNAKTAVNRARTWLQQADGTWQHRVAS